MNDDLSRWNRAGLRRFRYVDGNAATHLETLRRALAERFPLWEAMQHGPTPGEDENTRLARLEAQYRARGEDPAWEIMRAFARAAHVLTEHLDAYANEGYLGTATQWENVRRLVEMIGYHPAPQASAETHLVLEAEAGRRGRVASGLQVQHQPADGGAPLIFETLEDLEVDAALNALRPAGWNHNPTPFSAEPDRPHWFAGADLGVSAGQVALLHDQASDRALPTAIDRVVAEGALLLETPPPGAWRKGDAALWVVPETVRRPRLNGPGVIQLPGDHGLKAGEGVGWRVGRRWHLARVAEADGPALRLLGGTPEPGRTLYRVIVLKDARDRDLETLSADYQALSTAPTGPAIPPSGLRLRESEHGRYYELVTTGIKRLYLIPRGAEPLGVVGRQPANAGFVFPGDPGGLADGQWVVGEAGATRLALKIRKLERREDHFVLHFTSAPGRLTRLYGPFRHRLRPRGYDRNDTPLGGTVRLEGSVPAALRAGRSVILEGGDGQAQHTTLRAVDRAAGTITLAGPPPAGFTLGNTRLRANVVRAGHGEGRPTKVLGDGDATIAGQTFTLAEPRVSFVADATMPTGVAADLEVEVDGRPWRQVADLGGSGPTDAHYAVRLDEDGHLHLHFGDGEHGRRLPTGQSNVRVRYRVGAGLAGNLPPGSLTKLVRPHPLVAVVAQPLPASGGNEREDATTLREDAPGALFTLGRAVSLEDYRRLAARHASVWQARAFVRPTPGARGERVEVVVVPAGGGPLGDLEDRLAAYLEGAGLPGVQVRVRGHQAVPIHCRLSVQVAGEGVLPARVAEALRAVLLEAFSLRRRGLGQPLYLSELYAVVEGVPGVANAQVVLLPQPGPEPTPRPLRRASGAIQVLRPAPHQVLYLDPARSTLAIATREFRP